LYQVRSLLSYDFLLIVLNLNIILNILGKNKKMSLEREWHKTAVDSATKISERSMVIG